MLDHHHDRPRTVAVIPARGGSKGVPGKNLRPVGGVPLVVRAVRACLAASSIDAVIVSTDDEAIATRARAAGAEIVDRPADLSGDRATSESALLHALDELAAQGRPADVLVFVQCTSPFVDPAALDEAVTRIVEGDADSVFAAVATYEFLWGATRISGSATLVTGLNHDLRTRPRRQDRTVDYRETGAFYAMDVTGFRAAGHRFFGRTAVVEVPELTAVDVDTADDLVRAEALAATGLIVDPTAPPHDDLDVDVVFTDFDGVHTDDTATVDERGLESVRVSRSDGLGVERLRRAGVPLVIVSKETNPVVSARARKLQVEVAQGIEDKAGTVRAWLARHGVPAERAAYLGNDLNDLAPMGVVGWPLAVADARDEVRAAARAVLSCSGGRGAVREVCDRVLRERTAATPRARGLRAVTSAAPVPADAAPGSTAEPVGAGSSTPRGAG